MAEDAQVGLSIHLPEAFIHLFFITWCPKHTQPTGLPIDPVTFEGASIGPDKLTIAALGVLIINNRVIALLGSEALISVDISRVVAVGENWSQAHLACVAERAILHGLEAQFTVLQTQLCNGNRKVTNGVH